MKGLFRMLATAVVAILLIVSCTKDPYITPGPGAGNSISLGSAAFSAEYVFSTNYDWTARYLLVVKLVVKGKWLLLRIFKYTYQTL